MRLDLRNLPLGGLYSYVEDSDRTAFGTTTILTKKKARYEATSIEPHLFPHYPDPHQLVWKVEADFYFPGMDECALRIIDGVITRHDDLLAMCSMFSQEIFHHFPRGKFLLCEKFHLMFKMVRRDEMINLGTHKLERIDNATIQARKYILLEPVFYIK